MDSDNTSNDAKRYKSWMREQGHRRTEGKMKRENPKQKENENERTH